MKSKTNSMALLGVALLLGGSIAAQEPELYEDEFTERPAQTSIVEEVRNEAAAKKKTVKKKRRCIRCGGRGKTISVTRQTCDRCGGSGILMTEIELKDSVNGRPWWHGNYKTTRKSANKQPCPNCNRSGRAMVKKETECSLCKGTGEMP